MLEQYVNKLPFFPEQASTQAQQVDILYFVLLALSGFITLLIAVIITFFIVYYRKSAQRDRTQKKHTNLKIEAAWIGTSIVLSLIVFTWAAGVFFHMMTPPLDADEIYIVAKQWMWKVQHPSGQSEINELHVPIGRKIKLMMISQDVIHSFYVPAFRIKHDVLPQRYTEVWFEATRPGEYHLFCAEYCGTEHSRMRGTVKAMEPEDFEEWLTQAAQPKREIEKPLAAGAIIPGTLGEAKPAQGQLLSMAESGMALLDRFACVQCHPSLAPGLEGLYGREVQLIDGSSVTADEAYIRESILNPSAKIVLGYPPIMPSFEGQISEEEILQIIAYTRASSPTAEEGKP